VFRALESKPIFQGQGLFFTTLFDFFLPCRTWPQINHHQDTRYICLFSNVLNFEDAAIRTLARMIGSIFQDLSASILQFILKELKKVSRIE
jgi:hypothetical protein